MRPVPAPPPFSLSLVAVDVLWEYIELHERPFPFDIPYHGVTEDERAELGQRVMDDLQARGLAVNGELDPSVEHALRLLAAAPVTVAIAGLVDVVSRTVLTARIGADDGYAVLGVVDGQVLRVNYLTPDEIACAAVRLLPATPLPLEDPDVAAALPAPGQLDVRGLGQFLVIGTDHQGEPIPLPPLSWLDSFRGRYVNFAHGEGEMGITYAPTNDSLLIAQLNSLLAVV
jgi:hypothetical protein